MKGQQCIMQAGASHAGQTRTGRRQAGGSSVLYPHIRKERATQLIRLLIKNTHGKTIIFTKELFRKTCKPKWLYNQNLVI